MFVLVLHEFGYCEEALPNITDTSSLLGFQQPPSKLIKGKHIRCYEAERHSRNSGSPGNCWEAGGSGTGASSRLLRESSQGRAPAPHRGSIEREQSVPVPGEEGARSVRNCPHPVPAAPAVPTRTCGAPASLPHAIPASPQSSPLPAARGPRPRCPPSRGHRPTSLLAPLGVAGPGRRHLVWAPPAGWRHDVTSHAPAGPIGSGGW